MPCRISSTSNLSKNTF